MPRQVAMRHCTAAHMLSCIKISMLLAGLVVAQVQAYKHEYESQLAHFSANMPVEVCAVAGRGRSLILIHQQNI